MSGIGNVYRAEVLFRHRISPFRPGRDITHDEWDTIWVDLCELLRAGVKAGRIVTTLPEDRPRRARALRRGRCGRIRFTSTGEPGEPCRICGTEIQTEVMATRNLFWCPTCQAG